MADSHDSRYCGCGLRAGSSRKELLKYARKEKDK